MEEVLVLLVQVVAEVLVDVLIYLPFDVPLSRDEKTGERRGAGWLFVYALAGGVLGGLSLLLVPDLVLRSPALRLANLAVAPLASGGVSWGLAAWRRSRGARADPPTHFWTAFWFVLAFGAVRLAYGGR